MDRADFEARRQAATAAIVAATGIDEAMIHRLVHGFYDRVRDDALLGPVFAEKITDWGPHLEKMCAFWSSVALLTGAYHGRPMQKHMSLAVDSVHFDRWLALFREAARNLCPPAAADHFIGKAELIASSIEMGLATVNGIRLAKGERYHRAM